MTNTLSLRALAVNHPALAADAAIRRVVELEAEIAALRAERVWQPIETALRDGKTFLFRERHRVCVGQFATDQFSAAQWFLLEWPLDGQQAHWMPLPEPPAP